MLAKPIVVQEAQLLGKWQCVDYNGTLRTFTFGSEQKVSAIVDANFPSPDDETLAYRVFADGTWTVNGGKIGLNIKPLMFKDNIAWLKFALFRGVKWIRKCLPR